MQRTFGKGLVAALMVGLSAGPAWAAQDSDSGGERTRVSVGGFWTANVSSVSLSPPTSGVTTKQWNGGGVSVDIPMSRAVSLDARVFWNRRGARVELDGPSAYQDVMADYISLPALVRIARPGTVRPYVVGGVETSVRTRARICTVVGGTQFGEDASSVVGRWDVALSFGGGLERAHGSARVFVEGLWSHGLRNVLAGDASSESARTRTFTASAGVRF